jgi:hypothetical protein
MGDAHRLPRSALRARREQVASAILIRTLHGVRARGRQTDGRQAARRQEIMN